MISDAISIKRLKFSQIGFQHDNEYMALESNSGTVWANQGSSLNNQFVKTSNFQSFRVGLKISLAWSAGFGAGQLIEQDWKIYYNRLELKSG